MIKKSGQHLLLPFYHIVSDDNPIHVKNLYQPRSVQEFKDDLDFLLTHYESISLKQLIKLNKEGKSIDKNYFHLTFDDGLSEFYTIAAPILKEKNIHATIFLNTDFIDNKELFYRFKASILFDKLKNNSILSVGYKDIPRLDELAKINEIDFSTYLSKEKPYLDSNQIKELIGQGFTFGTHSKDHPLYNELSIEEQLTQTTESIDFVVDKFKLDYKVFSFPFTDDGVSKSFFEEIDNSTDLTFGSAGIKEDTVQNHLQRLAMETDKTAKEIIKAEYLYYIMKQKVGKHKIIRQ